MITGNSGPLTATTEPNEMKHVGEESLKNKQRDASWTGPKNKVIEVRAAKQRVTFPSFQM